MLNENNMLDTFFDQAEVVSNIINDFSKKQKIKFREFHYIPELEKDFLNSVAEFHGELVFDLKTMAYDLTNEIQQLTAIEYSYYVENLFDNSSCEEDFNNKLLLYPEWLTKNK